MTIAKQRRVGLALRVVLPVLLGVVVWVLTGVMWSSLRGQESAALSLAMAEHANQSARLVEVRSAERLLPFKRMAVRMGRNTPAGDANLSRWRGDAQAYLLDHPELLAIEWVDGSSRLRWIEPEAGSAGLRGRVLNTDPLRAWARDHSTAIDGPAMTRPIELHQGVRGVLFFHPIRHAGEPQGHLVFAASSGPLASQLLGPVDNRFELVVYDEDTQLLRRGPEGLGDWTSARAHVAGQGWRVEVRPTPETIALYRSSMPLATLAAGLGLGLAFMGLGYMALGSLRQSEALRTQSAELQAILDLLPVMVWHKDTQNNIIRANAAAAQGAGVSPAEMAGQPTATFYPDTAELFYRGDLEVMRGGVPRLGVVEPIDTDEGRRHVQTDKLPVLNASGEVTGIIVIATDITHLKQAEAQARRATEWFEAFMSHDPEMKWALDTAGRFVYINKAYEKSQGVTLEEARGRTPLEVLPDATKAFIKAAEHIAWNDPTMGQPSQNEINFPTQDGVTPLLITRFLFQVDGGEVIEGGSAIDLTATKQAEELLAKHNQDLETLLYVISHDLREPLRGIRNFSDLIATGYAEHLDERGQDMLARIARGAVRLDGLLSDVLLLSRAQRAQTADALLDTAEVVADVLHELHPTIENTGATITVGDDLPKLRMDPFWLRQAVLNLVANAIKFTPAGEKPDIEIDAYAPAPGASVVGLVVRDRGPGVAPDMREKIFGLFQRGVGRNVPGSGAGLAIVAQVAQRYGGKAWVKDRPGGGAEFFLTISDKGQ